MSDDLLTHLAALVAIDTSNPPRAMHADHAIVACVADALRAAHFDVAIDDLGDGCVNVHGVRGGGARLLFNCHLDTVPAGPGWTSDPWTLHVADGRARGLGACDIKGAAACLLVAATQTDAPCEILFSTDEEAGGSRCVRTFASAQRDRYDLAVVAEPTNGRAVLSHRGLATFELAFEGTAAHTSRPDAAADSAVHHAVLWGGRAIDAAAPDDLRLNLGVVEGGVKANIAAPSARIVYGVRPPGAIDAASAGRALASLTDARTTLTSRFEAPGLARHDAAARWASSFGVPPGPDVDFWTEAALFADAGIGAMVFGPGDIAQAHAAEEFVSVADLEAVAAWYGRMIERGADVSPSALATESRS